jgi:hypothetical protein
MASVTASGQLGAMRGSPEARAQIADFRNEVFFDGDCIRRSCGAPDDQCSPSLVSTAVPVIYLRRDDTPPTTMTKSIATANQLWRFPRSTMRRGSLGGAHFFVASQDLSPLDRPAVRAIAALCGAAEWIKEVARRRAVA